MANEKTANKKIFKKWWFWVAIVVVLLIIVTATQGSTNNTNTSNNNNDNSDNSETKVESKKQVTLIDFSTMSYSDIASWCEENKIGCYEKKDYSDTVEKDGFISQSVKEGEKVDEGGRVDVTYSLGKAPTVSQQNAVKTAESYLSHSSFSRSGLIGQLEYEGFSKDDATYGVDSITVNWDEQAAKTAESYLSHSSFSRKGLIDQLKYEGFTQSQAEYGVSQVGL